MLISSIEMKSVLIFVFAAFSYVSTASVEDKRCAWGESFWCSSLKVAKQCNAIDHCKTTVWSNQVLEKDPGEVCQFCEVIVDDVVKYIQENASEAQIMTFLTSACELVPDKSMSDECKLIINTYLPEIIKLITQKVDSQVICSLLGLCKGMKDPVKHYEVSAPKVLDPAICTDCKKFAQDIMDLITNTATQDQIVNLIDQYFCKNFGPEEAVCKGLVKEFLPELMQLISNEFSVDKFCQPFCMTSIKEMRLHFISLRLKKSALFQAAKQSSPEECVMCKTIVSELQVLDRDQAVQTEIENFLKISICSRLKNYSAECNMAVDMYAPELFELLATELDPEARCKGFGFCPASDPIRDSMPKTPVKFSAECVMCEFVMKELKGLIGDNATEAEIIVALEKVCSLLPTTIQDSCKSFVDLYGKAILDLLVQDLSPEQICTALGLCNSSVLLPLTDPEVSEKCLVCETLVQYAEALLDNTATVAEIEHVVMKICNFLPDSMKKECNDIVQLYGALIINYIATEYTPKQICTTIKLCAEVGSDSVKMAPLVPAKTKQPLYYKCTYGESYWCTSQANAELCEAVDHCKKYVW